MIKAAVVGHSQVPNEISIPNVNTRVFRKPGARIHHFHNDLLNAVLEFSPDIIVVFLGGNDIDASDDCAQRVATGLKDIIEILKANCREVIFVEIEWRNFTRTRVPGLTSEIYNQRRRTINRNLKRYCSSRRIHAINTSTESIERVRRDGVHFDSLSSACVKTKIVSAITHAASRIQSNL